MVLGFSDLARLVRERPLVLAKGSGVRVYDEHGRDYIETVSSFYCASLGFSDEELIEAANGDVKTAIVMGRASFTSEAMRSR